MSSESPQRFDVCVLGGGPAGCITALRLAAMGRRVCLIERSAFPRSHAGESLTIGIWPILEILGLRALIEQSGALIGNKAVVRWAETNTEILTSGQLAPWLLVDRGKFDALLLQAAGSRGVQLFQPGHVRSASHGDRGWHVEVVANDTPYLLKASHLVDATGRTGFLRGARERLSPSTIAIWGQLRGLPHSPATLVEAIPDGWCWGAPVPGGTFSTMIFMDADRLRLVRRESLERLFRSQLAGTELFAAMSEWPLAGPLTARDATSYFSTEPIGTSFTRVGETNYALDPLSSTGVEKAMQCGNVAAIAINTLIDEPDRAELCLGFYRQRQKETVSAHSAWAADFYKSVKRFADFAFWQIRSNPPDSSRQQQTKPTEVVSAARISLDTAVHVSSLVRTVNEPCILGDRICAHAAIVHPALSRPVAFLQGVALCPLLNMVESGLDMECLLRLWSTQVAPQQAYRIAQWLFERRILEAVNQRNFSGSL
jgi:flavin-dependent dehydrogenase